MTAAHNCLWAAGASDPQAARAWELDGPSTVSTGYLTNSRVLRWALAVYREAVAVAKFRLR